MIIDGYTAEHLINRAIGGTTLEESVKALQDVFVDHDLAEKGEPMSDLIYRQEVIRWVKTECNPYGKPTIDFESGKKFIEHLEKMPSAEPEIVRCKNCKYYNPIGVCNETSWAVTEDSFCSCAERRTDADE